MTYRNRAGKNSAGRKAAGNRRTGKSKAVSKRRQSAPSQGIAPFVKVAVIAVAVLIAASLAFCGHTTAKRSAQWKHDHKWQSTVEDAETYFGVDLAFTDCMLTILQVESSGDEDIDERHDIAQAWEGDGKKYMKKGVKKKGIKRYTVEASIYAGTYELSLCIRDFKKYLGYDPNPQDPNDLALLAQGYNYGHLGWFSWLKSEGISEWTLEVSERYQERIDGLGTAIHGQKIMDTYRRIASKSK